MFSVLGWLFLTAGGLFAWGNLHPAIAFICYAAALGSFIEAILDKFRSKK